MGTNNLVFYFVFRYLLIYKDLFVDNLIDKNIGIQNNTGMTEDEAWLLMLKKSQNRLYNSYKRKDNESIDGLQKEIDFIQRQLVRLSQR